MAELVDIGDGVLVDEDTGEIIGELPSGTDRMLLLARRAQEADGQEKAWARVKAATKAALMKSLPERVMSVGDNEAVVRYNQRSRKRVDVPGVVSDVLNAELTIDERVSVLQAVTGIDREKLPDSVKAVIEPGRFYETLDKPFITVDPVRKRAPGS